MTTVTVEEAQAKLTEIIQRLRPGEEIRITDRGVTTALVKKVDAVPPRLRPPPGLGKGMITILSDDDDDLTDFEKYTP